MTVNQIKKLFESIAGAHYFIKHFEYGNTPAKADAEVDETKYPALYVVHDDSTQLTNTIQRTYTLIVCDLVNTDLSNNDEVESDTEQTLSDIIKILRQESDYYDVVGDPKIVPFRDKYGDAVSGNEATVVIETLYNTGFCDVPSDIFGYPGTTGSNGLPITPGIDCDSLTECAVISTMQQDIIDLLNAGYINLGDLSATAPIDYDNITGVFSITQVNSTTDGYLTSTDYNNFVSAYNSITALITAGPIVIGDNISLLTNDAGYITSSALTGYVPYTGATTNVDLGIYSLTTGQLNVNGIGSTNATHAAILQNSSNAPLLYVRNDGKVYVNSAGGFSADVTMGIDGTIQADAVRVKGYQQIRYGANVYNTGDSRPMIEWSNSTSNGVFLTGMKSDDAWGIFCAASGDWGFEINRNNRNIGISASAASDTRMTVTGQSATSADYAAKFNKSTSVNLLSIRNDGLSMFGANTYLDGNAISIMAAISGGYSGTTGYYNGRGATAGVNRFFVGEAYSTSTSIATIELRASGSTGMNNPMGRMNVSSNGTGNFTGTSLTSASTFYLDASVTGYSGSSSGQFAMTAGSIFGIIGSTATNRGFRMDSSGFRIGFLSTLHTANTVPFYIEGSLAGRYVRYNSNTLEAITASETGMNVLVQGSSANPCIYMHKADNGNNGPVMRVSRGYGSASNAFNYSTIAFGLPNAASVFASVEDAAEIRAYWTQNATTTLSTQYSAVSINVRKAGVITTPFLVSTDNALVTGTLTVNNTSSVSVLTTTQNDVIVGSAAVATTATEGFFYITSCAGTPTGVPTSVTGRIPLVVDSANDKLYIHSNGAWVPTGASEASMRRTAALMTL